MSTLCRSTCDLQRPAVRERTSATGSATRTVRVRVKHERETAAKTCSSVSRRLLTTQWRGERAPLFSDAHGARTRWAELSIAACTSLQLVLLRECGACQKQITISVAFCETAAKKRKYTYAFLKNVAMPGGPETAAGARRQKKISN